MIGHFPSGSTLNMWEQYRKRLIPTQIFIVSLCLLGALAFKLPLLNVLIGFVVMEIGAAIGAAWASRLTRRLQATSSRLPLDR